MDRLEQGLVEELERELRARAFDRDAELILSTDPDGRWRASFKQFMDPIAAQGVVLLQATAVRKRVALEGLLTVDARCPPYRAGQ